MPTPKQGYYLNSERLPSVTTIIGRFKDSGALIKWAYNQGKAGVDLYEKRDEACDIGTLVHAMVEADIHKQPHPAVPEQFADRVRLAYAAWQGWWDQSKLTIFSTEDQLVSKRYRYGGTPDAIGRDTAGRVTLLDWKTSNGIYPDYLIQLAAYEHLWNENHPRKKITGGAHLLRFSKEDGSFHHHWWPDLAEGWQQFLLFRKAYDLDKILKKRT